MPQHTYQWRHHITSLGEEHRYRQGQGRIIDWEASKQAMQTLPYASCKIPPLRSEHEMVEAQVGRPMPKIPPSSENQDRYHPMPSTESSYSDTVASITPISRQMAPSKQHPRQPAE